VVGHGVAAQPDHQETPGHSSCLFFHVRAARASWVHKQLVTDVPTAEATAIAKLIIGLGVGGNATSGLRLGGLVSGWRRQLT
jgi:hypothetical protein